MVLPTSGLIQASDINVELGRAWNAWFDINGSAERGLAGKPSGAIAFSDFYGKASIIREPPSGDFWSMNNPVYGWTYISFYGMYELAWNGVWVLTEQNGKPPPSRVVGNWTYYRGSHKGGDSYAVYRIGKY